VAPGTAAVNVNFAYPWMLAVAPVLGLFAAAAILLGHARRKARLARFGAPEALARLAPQDAAHPPRYRALRLGAATLLLGVALSGPRWGESAAIIESEGIDIAIALDVSLSMLAEDERPSRLERMKQEVRRLRAIAPGDRVALIAFAGRSYVLTPLTSDDGALELFLENLDPTLVGVAGSALAPPMRQGIDLLLAARGGADRALVIMSDGEAFDDHEEAKRIAIEAMEGEIHVVTVGFGTPGGGTIPLPETGGAEVKRDDNREIVISKYDETLLREIARAAEGSFIAADETDKGTRVRRALADLESARQEEERKLARPPQHHWFVLVALVLLLIDAWMVDGGQWPRRRRAQERRVRPEATSTAVAVLIAALAGFTPAPLTAQASAERAMQAQAAGRLPAAIREYRAAISAGDKRAVVIYNLGTALLAADSVDAAIEALERATHLPDPEVRRRARYNLGLAYLKRGLRLEGEPRTTALTQARRELRTALLESPGNLDAQWNYELALRTPTGGSSNTPPPPRPQNQPQQQRRDQMTQQQAEALLDAAAREERETQARRQRGDRQQRSTGQRDW
jgi:Ca-activated chloride channel family protein